MDRKPDVTSAETVAEPLAAAVQPPSNGSRPVSFHSSTHEEERFAPGTLLNGRYRIIGLLGKGGMGEVYRATDMTLGQSVALKFLPGEAAGNVRLLERFHGEVRVARQVSHANVCRVYDIGEADGLPFISMEYIDGEDLASLLQRIGRLPSDKALETARKICAGLAAAHDKGVIHRDLKPQNIMLNKRGEVVIMDFGLAAVADSLTGQEARHGTPAYMAPEQLKGSEVTARSDIYALGLVLYELFTGKRPFDAKTMQSMIDMQESRQFASMTSLVADVDPAVEKVIRRCLEPDPARRPASPLSVSAALPGGDPLAAALAAGETPSPEMVAASGKTAGMPRKWALLCLGLTLGCLFAAPFLLQRRAGLLQVPLELSPDVLARKSRETAALLGYGNKPRDSILFLFNRTGLFQYFATRSERQKWQEWFKAEAPISSNYRESPYELVAWPYGFATMTNPPHSTPGMTRVELDGHGRLRAFSGVPYRQGGAPKEPVPVENVFRAAQLDIAQFTEVPPKTLPEFASDQLKAWKGLHPAIPGVELTIEVAWWRGQVTWVKFLWPWMRDDGSNRLADYSMNTVRSIVVASMVVFGLIFAVLMARRNWRLNRVDKRGAFRLGAAMALLLFLYWALQVHVTTDGEILDFFLDGAGRWLRGAALLWLLYVALEPALRSRWPQSMVTWNRLLAGKFLDAQVNADVLSGFTVAALLVTMFVVLAPLMGDTTVIAVNLWTLEGTRKWLTILPDIITDSVQMGLWAFFMIFGLRALLRKEWLAALVAALLLAATDGGLSFSGVSMGKYALYAALYAAMIFILLRLGLVASISALVFNRLMNVTTLGTDLSAWHAPIAIATMLMTIGLVLFAFWRALGSQDLLTGDEHAAASG